MSVSDAEIKCYEYINAIRDIIEFTGKGIYGLDKVREKIHDDLCKLFNLDKERTKKYTDNIDLEDDRVAENLYLSLLDESRSKYFR